MWWRETDGSHRVRKELSTSTINARNTTVEHRMAGRFAAEREPRRLIYSSTIIHEIQLSRFRHNRKFPFVLDSQISVNTDFPQRQKVWNKSRYESCT